MPSCVNCGRNLEPPSGSRRYCPYCGMIRVLADPPAGGPDAAFLVVGRDVLGPQTGDVYTYEAEGTTPRRVDPLEGPFGAEGAAWRDLFAASDTPLPELAWNSYRMPSWIPESPPSADVGLGAALTEAAVRHGRIFTMVESGQLSALDARTLEYVPGWQFPRWTEGRVTTGLHVSETLVYGAVRTGGSTLLRAVDAGHGRSLIQHPLPYGQPQVLIAGGEVLVVGDLVHQQQPVERYRLADYRNATTPKPWLQAHVRLQGEPGMCSPRPARLGRDFVFAARDGKIYRWGSDDSAGPQVLWPNPMNARMEQPTWVPLGREEIGFVASARHAGGGVALVRLRLAPDRTAVFQGILELPMLRDSRWQQVTAAQGRVYLLTQGPGQPIAVHSIPLAGSPADQQSLPAIAGTPDAEVQEFQIVPWQDQPYLLVHYAIGRQRDFWLVHPFTGATSELPRHPPREHSVNLLWMTGRVWQVDLTAGQVARLA